MSTFISCLDVSQFSNTRNFSDTVRGFPSFPTRVHLSCLDHGTLNPFLDVFSERSPNFKNVYLKIFSFTEPGDSRMQVILSTLISTLISYKSNELSVGNHRRLALTKTHQRILALVNNMQFINYIKSIINYNLK